MAIRHLAIASVLLCITAYSHAEDNEARIRQLETEVAQLKKDVAALKEQLSKTLRKEDVPPVVARTAAISGVYKSGDHCVVKFFGGNAVKIIIPGDDREWSGTYTIDAKTIVVDLGWGKRIYQVVDETTLSTEEGAKKFVLKKE